MIPKIVHQTSASISWEERRLLKRAQALMPDFEFRMWSDEDNLQLIRRVLPHREQAFSAFRKGVIRADIARCLFLYEQGGTYVDTDYKFYKALGPEILNNRIVLGIEDPNNAWIKTVKYGNAFMASVKGEPLWIEFIEAAFDLAEAGEENPLLIAGPHALSLFLAERPSKLREITTLPPSIIYPGMTEERPDHRAIGDHLCWGSWRNKPLLHTVRNRLRRILTATF